MVTSGGSDTHILSDGVTTTERAARYFGCGYWTGDTLSERVAQHAANRGSEVACVDRLGRRRRSFTDLYHDASGLAEELVRHGVGPGSVISVQLPNCYEAVTLALATQSLGAVINPLLPTYRSHELAHVYETARPQIHFTPTARHSIVYGDLVDDARRRSSWRPLHVPLALGESDPLADCFDQARAGSRGSGSMDGVRRPRDQGRSVSEVIFTSGTEAIPKAIMHTENTANFSMRAAYAGLEMGPDDIVWMPSPIGHSTGFNYGVRFALYHGLKLVLQDEWSAEDAYRLVTEEGCTYTLAATTFLHDLVQYTQTRRVGLPSMQKFGCGGAPVSEELVKRAEEVGMVVLRLYGATEFLVATWNGPQSSWLQRRQTDGCPLEGVEIAVRDADANSCEAGTGGEVWVRGPNTCVGFFADPERTAAAIDEEGWIRSGDLGIIDDEGYLSLVGRKKDIIIRGGLNIAPREVEDALTTFPEVRQASVVGIPDERLGERMCACLVLEPGCSVSLDSLNDRLVREGFAKYKLPEMIRVFDVFPMTASGKVQKHELRRLVRELADLLASGASGRVESLDHRPGQPAPGRDREAL